MVPHRHVATTDWREALPVLQAGAVTLRELRLSDAASLLAMLTTEEVSRFISPPPTTVDGFERFIAWTHRERAAGRYVCFGIVPTASSRPSASSRCARSAPASTSPSGASRSARILGHGVFQKAARQVLGFAFGEVGIQRLEARSAVANGRGNGALQKLGATREGVLRKSFMRHGEYHDQVIWSICQDEWREWETTPAAPTH